MSDLIRLRVTGMTCNHCVGSVRKALQAVPGVAAVEVSLELGEAVVDGQAAPDILIAAVREAGYEASVAD